MKRIRGKVRLRARGNFKGSGSTVGTGRPDRKISILWLIPLMAAPILPNVVPTAPKEPDTIAGETATPTWPNWLNWKFLFGWTWEIPDFTPYVPLPDLVEIAEITRPGNDQIVLGPKVIVEGRVESNLPGRKTLEVFVGHQNRLADLDRNNEFKIEFDSLPPGVHKIRTELTSPNSSSSQPDQSRRIIIPRLYHSFTGTDYGWTFDTTANVESDWTLSSDEISNEFVRAKFGRPILDIYYVVDTSISMSITLPTFYKALGIHLTNESGLLDRIVSGSDQPRLQLGLITYHDTDGDDVDPVLNQKYFGTDLTEFQKQFRNIRFSPGGDWPEHHYDALAFANNLMRVNRSWAQNPMKIAILVTDGPARVDRVSLQEISDSLRQNNVELITVMLHPLSSPTDWIDFSSDYNWKANRTNPEFSEDEYDQKFRTRLVAVGDSDERFAFQQGILDAKRLARATDGSFFRFRDEKFQPIKQRMMAAQQMGLGLYQDIVGPKIESAMRNQPFRWIAPPSVITALRQAQNESIQFKLSGPKSGDLVLETSFGERLRYHFTVPPNATTNTTQSNRWSTIVASLNHEDWKTESGQVVDETLFRSALTELTAFKIECLVVPELVADFDEFIILKPLTPSQPYSP